MDMPTLHLALHDLDLSSVIPAYTTTKDLWESLEQQDDDNSDHVVGTMAWDFDTKFNASSEPNSHVESLDNGDDVKFEPPKLWESALKDHPLYNQSNHERMPKWASRLYSSRVTAMASVRTVNNHLRLLVGCENGELWVFAERGDLDSSSDISKRDPRHLSYVEEAKEKLDMKIRRGTRFTSSQVSLTSLDRNSPHEEAPKSTFSTLLTLPSNLPPSKPSSPKESSPSPSPSPPIHQIHHVHSSYTLKVSAPLSSELHHSQSTTALQALRNLENNQSVTDSRPTSPLGSIHSASHATPFMLGNGHRHKASVSLGVTEVDIEVAPISRQALPDGNNQRTSVSDWIHSKKKEEGVAIGSLMHATQSASGGAASKEAGVEVGGGTTREEDGAKMQSIFLGSNGGSRHPKGHSRHNSALHLLGEKKGLDSEGDDILLKMKVPTSPLGKNSAIIMGRGDDPEDEELDDRSDLGPDRLTLGQMKLEPVANTTCSAYGAKVVNIQGLLEDNTEALIVYENGDILIVDVLDGHILSSTSVQSFDDHTKFQSPLQLEAVDLVDDDSGVFAILRAKDHSAIIPMKLDGLQSGTITDLKHPILSSAIFWHKGLPFYTFLSENNRIFLSSIAFKDGWVQFSESQEAGKLPTLSVYNEIKSFGDRFVAIGHDGVLIYRIEDQAVISLKSIPATDVTHALPIGNKFLYVCTKRSNMLYHVSEHTVEDIPACLNATIVPVSNSDALQSIEFVDKFGSEALFVVQQSDGQRRIALIRLLDDFHSVEYMFETSTDKSELRSVPSYAKVLTSETMIIGYTNGRLSLLSMKSAMGINQTHSIQLDGEVSWIANENIPTKTKKVKTLLVGTANGYLYFIAARSLKIIRRFNISSSPVICTYLVSFEGSEGSEGSLHNSVLAVGAVGSVACFSWIDQPEMICSIPSPRSPLLKMAAREDDLILFYECGIARTWNVPSREFRRSTTFDSAEGFIQMEGGMWLRLSIRHRFRSFTGLTSMELRRILSAASDGFLNKDGKLKPIRTRTMADDLVDVMTEEETHGKKSDSHSGAMNFVRFLLGSSVLFGLDDEIDDLYDQIGIKKWSAGNFIPRFGISTEDPARIHISGSDNGATVFCISPTITACRLLTIASLIQAFLNYSDTELPASGITLYFASLLPDIIGQRFCPPSLEYLCDYYIDNCTEIQAAARLIFGSYLSRLPDSELSSLLDARQNRLPSRLEGDAALTVPQRLQDQSVLLLGLIACDKYAMMDILLLKDLAICVSNFLLDSATPYQQSIGVELCSKGFSIWQNYVNAMQLVRSLVSLTTGLNPATSPDIRMMARQAVFQVAGVNTPLFITTMSFDLANAKDVSLRNGSMKLLGFMIRKKPLILYANLPRLTEAVVKSLDPASATNRQVSHQAATFILHELVSTYPTIAFHGASQRLAVGTHEGAAIMYDLKTATRVYVLEGHRRPLAAVSFSPDGRRLVTTSVEEGKALVWKVGQGLLGSFFSGGAPPRQTAGISLPTIGGSSTSVAPFKTLDYSIPDTPTLSPTAMLQDVSIEWPGERTAKLKIRDTVLQFNC